MRTGLLSHVSSRVRRVPPLVWLITGTYLTALLAYSFLMPTYRAPDEPLHVDLNHLFAEDLRYPAWDDRDTGPEIQRSLGMVRFGRRSLHLTEQEALPKDERPSYEQMAEPPKATGVNQIPQHPPLYYVVSGGAERAVETMFGGNDPSWDMEVWFYRLVSIAFVAPLPLIIWSTARRLGAPDAVGAAACLVPLAIPQLTHIGSSVNNDNPMMLAFWLLTPLTLRVAGGDVRPRTAALAGVISGVGLLSKGFALVLPLWVAAALLLAWRRAGRDATRRVVTAGLTYGGVTFAVGGWWWVRNLVRYGEISPSRFEKMVANTGNDEVDLWGFVRSWAYTTTRRFWGDFGWYDGAYVPAVAFGLLTAAVLVGIAIACTRRDRVAHSVLSDRLLLAAPLLLLVATQFAFAFRGYLLTSRLPGMQGRYWFGAVAGMAVVAVLGWANLAPRFQRLLPIGVLVSAVAMQATAVRAIVNQYWGAPGSAVADRFRAIVAWAPLPGEIIAAGTVLGALVVVTTFGAVCWSSLRSVREPSSAASSSPDELPAAPSPTLVAP
jgi:small subunit ribosomal protein S36